MRKYTELLTIPAALLVMWLYNIASNWFGLHTMTWEQVGMVFPALVIFLVVVGFVRIILLVLFPGLYRHFDPSFEENKSWKLLTPRERYLSAFVLYCVLLLLFGLIANGM